MKYPTLRRRGPGVGSPYEANYKGVSIVAYQQSTSPWISYSIRCDAEYVGHNYTLRGAVKQAVDFILAHKKFFKIK